MALMTLPLSPGIQGMKAADVNPWPDNPTHPWSMGFLPWPAAKLWPIPQQKSADFPNISGHQPLTMPKKEWIPALA
jgi:hypothetical protein